MFFPTAAVILVLGFAAIPANADRKSASLIWFNTAFTIE